jgi:o-succinylbenzoate synthase
VRLERVELRLVPLQLRERFEISSGGRQDRVIFLVALHAEGHVGWGECVAAEDPGYSSETTETAWHVLNEFVLPRVMGREAASPEELVAPAHWVRGHRMAKAAVEMAAWDLFAKMRNVPLAVALGSTPRPVPVGVSLGLQVTNDALIEKVGAHIALGYQRIKVKIKPGRDVEMMEEVRAAFPDIALSVDANAAYLPAHARHLARLDRLGLVMIEQPLAYDDLREHARLQQQLATPICLDESIENAHDARLALELGACRIINIKPGRVGGFASAREIHDVCVAAGVPVWCGGMLESGVGRAHNASLATLPGFTLPGDISASRRYWERDLVSPEFEVENGTMSMPAGAGIAVEVDVERIEHLAVRRATIE